MAIKNRSITYLFIFLLPILFTLIVIIGYSQAKVEYLRAGTRSMDKQLNVIVHMIKQIDKQVNENKVPLADAQSELKKTLSGPKLPDGTRDLSKLNITLGPGDYLFITNAKGDMLMHPQLEGQNLFHVEAPDGQYIIQHIIKNKQGELHYTWQNPFDSEPRKKIAIFQYIPEWDWYIAISTYEENFYGHYSQIKYLLIFLVIGSYLITIILFYFARKKEQDLVKSTIVSKQLVHANQSILKTLAVALEERDAYTLGHSQRVAYYMKVIARQMGLTQELVETIYTGGLLHDIGKIGIEDSILLKPGRLTQEEFQIIKTHPVRGEALLHRLYGQLNEKDDHNIKLIFQITRNHHERYDGRGYPDQLKELDIPLVARIAAVADSFDAMTSNRAYRQGLSYQQARNEIMNHKGTQFCPDVVDAFMVSITEEEFNHAHHITRADELLLERINSENQIV